MEIELAHDLVNIGQVDDILSGVLDHVLSEGSGLPELVVLLHQLLDVLLLRVNYVQIHLEQIVQRDVVVLEVYVLLRVIESLADDSMSNLSVEDLVAYYVILVDQGTLVLAEVVENFEDFIVLHYLAEAEGEGVDLEQVKQVARPIEVHLYPVN